MTMEIKFYIEEITDPSCGVSTYVARRSDDFDNEGLPLRSALTGKGDSEWEAITDLCDQIYDNETGDAHD